ncbi:20110_t:CDS:2 [Racocetra persica]|uniref:20110_t:CDS:1 n=1 Tax=Racocetra persica TaxID=160502 RepID=A0ACA9LMF0_9GLOM|nr:20110_t:CDS:2 [Racocetra persica]
MADALDTKLRYKRGTCFGCRKCLYCGVDLQKQKCKCDITKPPHRGNQTDAVNWTADQTSFIYDKIVKYNYEVNLKEPFNFSLCSRCNNGLLKLKLTKKKLLSDSVKKTVKHPSKKIKFEHEIYDLTLAEDEGFYNSIDFLELDETSEEDIDICNHKDNRKDNYTDGHTTTTSIQMITQCKPKKLYLPGNW